VSALYIAFLREIPEGGAILDAGCGSGRDSLAFLRRGYRVVLIDASREMVAAATKHTGQQALFLRFDEIDFTDEFDGIWAYGSLLHVTWRDLHSACRLFDDRGAPQPASSSATRAHAAQIRAPQVRAPTPIQFGENCMSQYVHGPVIVR
jgi:SAM-dependent methyltransferase